MSEVLSPELQPLYEPLDAGRLGNLLAAIGNHEAKALLYLAMQPDKSYDRKGLVYLMEQTQADQPGYRPNDASFHQFSANSLEPIGLVNKIIWEDGKPRFQKIPDAAAEALAGGLAKLSLHHPDHSLGMLFGPTQSKGKAKSDGIRPPLRRLMIAEALLLADEPIQDIDIAKALNDNYHSISATIERMAEQDLLERRSDNPNTNDPTVTVTGPLDNYPYRSNLKAITLAVVKGIQELGNEKSHSRSEILAKVLEIQPGYGTLKSFRHNAYASIANLAEAGVLRLEGALSQYNYSQITLNPDQTRLWGELINLVRGIQQGDANIVQYAQAQGADLMRDPTAVRELIRKAYTTSSKVMFSDTPTDQIVLNVLMPGETLTTDQIMERLRTRNIALGANAIRGALQDLRKSKQIASEKRGIYNLWLRPGEST